MSDLKTQVDDYITRLKDVIPEIHEEIESVNIEMQYYDKALSELYHRIENENIFSSFKYYYPLRSILKKRREVKYRQAVLHKIKDSVFGLPDKLRTFEVRYFRKNPNYKEDFPSCID